MVDNKLKSILIDNTSGSTEILENIIDYLLDNLDKINYRFISSLKEDFKSFQVVEYFLKQTQEIIKRSEINVLQIFLTNYTKQINQELNLLFQNSIPHLKNKTKFVTISNSKTIENIFNSYSKIKPNIEVTILESRPKLEGRILANKLAENGLKINLITDAMASNAVENCESVVVGADKILKSGNVINKTGSRNLAILAKYFGKPFLVLADKNKFCNHNNFVKIKNTAKEIWDVGTSNIEINNYYFEIIERELITNIISN